MEKYEPFSQGVALGWHKLSLRDAKENINFKKELIRNKANNIKINISLSASYKSN